MVTRLPLSIVTTDDGVLENLELIGLVNTTTIEMSRSLEFTTVIGISEVVFETVIVRDASIEMASW
jgi:hypothetical protein